MAAYIRSWIGESPSNGAHAPRVEKGAGANNSSGPRGAEDAAQLLKTAVNNYPALALGAALAAGVILGWLIKRR